MKKARIAALAALIAGGALGAAGPAGAAVPAQTFCVHAPACPQGGIDKGDDLQAALDAASTNGANGNVVLVGDKGSPYAGPFSTGAKIADNAAPGPLRNSAATAGPEFLFAKIKGVGPGRPTLTADDGETVLAASATSIEGVDVRMPNPADGEGITLSGGFLRDVAVSAPAKEATGGIGVEVFGDVDIDGLRLENAGEISLKGRLIGDVTARDVQIETDHVGVQFRDVGLRLSDSRINAGTLGVGFSTGSLFVDDSAITTTAPASHGISFTDGGLTVEHTTLAHRGRPSGADEAVDIANVDDLPTRANIHTSVFAGYTRGFLRDPQAGPISIDVADSVWDASRDDLGGAGGGPFNETNDAHVAPRLVDLAKGDLRPAAGSPMIDRDSDTSGRFLDLDARPAVDGDGNGSVAADAGAFEYRRLAPQIDSADVPASGVPGQPLGFSVAAADPDGDRTTVAWAFGDGATATGSTAGHSYDTAGARSVTVTVTDELGLTTTRSFDVTIVAAGQAGGAQGGGSGQGSAPGAPRGDFKAPRLKSLKLSAKKTRVARAKRVKLGFSLDEPATISIVAKRGKRSGKIVLPAAQGKDKVKLARALKRLGKLKPGSVSITVTATDAAGNKSAPRLLRLKLSR